MALDESLAESAARGGICTLRFYGWEEPTLSLGYFQMWSDRDRHRGSRRCPLVRRCSGGGAILHDRELTYSLAVPGEHRLAENTEALYHAVHESLIDVLRELGIGGATFFADQAAEPLDPRAFLCFMRRSAGDVVLGANKLAGSAQRRRREAVLQHGSLILQTSSAAPEISGLKQATGVELDARQIIEPWVTRLRERLGLDVASDQLTDVELNRARHLETSRYATEAWNRRR